MATSNARHRGVFPLVGNQIKVNCEANLEWAPAGIEPATNHFAAGGSTPEALPVRGSYRAGSRPMWAGGGVGREDAAAPSGKDDGPTNRRAIPSPDL